MSHNKWGLVVITITNSSTFGWIGHLHMALNYIYIILF
jgi:hypothetical protein